MTVNEGLDTSRLAIGRLERALSRAEKAARNLPARSTEPAQAAGQNADIASLKDELHSAIAEIDAIMSQSGKSAHHG